VQGIETLINPQVGVVLINTPHNPTGYALTPEQVERINRAVAPYDCILAIDMVYAFNALEPQAIQALGGLDAARTIYIDSFSKKFGLPGLRLGYAICSNLELIEALRMMKAAESISASNLKLLFGAHLLRHHGHIAAATAAEIRRRYHAFREAIDGIEEYGVEVPPLTANANAFYLPLFLDRLLERSGLHVDAFDTRCQEHYRLEMVTGTRMYPPVGLHQGALRLENGAARITIPGQVIYAPDFVHKQRPFVRVSFGIEPRIAEAAARLRQACMETFVA
jgi:aspartate/methionine/tyrosine aminotransferase